MDKNNNFFGSINKRSLKYGSLSIVMVAVVIAIAVIINLFVGTLQDKGIIKTKFDLSQNKLYSIGDTSREILKKIDKDVIIYGLFDDKTVNGSSFSQLKSILNQYDQNKHISVKYIDLDKNPGFLEKLDPQGLKDIKNNDFVIDCEATKKIKKLSYTDLIETQTDPQTYQTTSTSFIGEQSFTGAIKYVASDKTPVVYFTEGHKEEAVDSNLKSLRTQLEANNYAVKSINLMINSKIPEDAAIIIVPSPKVDISVSEANLLKDFVGNGGNVVYLFDYLDNNPKLTKFEDLLQEYNIGLDYDKIKETDTSRYIQSPYAVVLEAPQSSIIPQAYPLVLVNSRSLSVLNNKKDYIEQTTLAKTSEKAIGEQIDKTKGADIKGPLNLAIAVNYKGGRQPGKVIVMGNASFITDEAQQSYGQYFQFANNFFTLSLNWMMDKKDEVLIDSKSLDSQKLNLSSQAQANVIGFMVLIVLPILILGFGTFVWLRRRHL